jgi:hypothetical protein
MHQDELLNYLVWACKQCYYVSNMTTSIQPEPEDFEQARAYIDKVLAIQEKFGSPFTGPTVEVEQAVQEVAQQTAKMRRLALSMAKTPAGVAVESRSSLEV